MKIFLFVCLAVGWASTEKLDRSYLPPPGSKFSGGSPGDIQVPLEFPKLNYSTGRPQVEDGIPEIELGTNRRPLPAGVAQSSSQRPDGSTYLQNSYAGPTTTTSYAITQTTTFGPADYEELDQSSGFVNASIDAQQPGLPQYRQPSGQNYQQNQPIRGQLPSLGPNYNQYQQEQNFQTTSGPYGSTTQRPLFVNNQNSRAYLPPAPPSIYKGQKPTGELSNNQEDFGYPSGQPQGPEYQDGQIAPTTGPSFIEGTNRQNVFIGKPNTSAPHHQDERYSSTTGPIANQQRFGSRVPTLQNQQRFQGIPNSPSSTVSPGQFTTSDGQNIYASQELPSSTSLPHYQYGQRLTTPGSNQQDFGSRLPQQNQNRYPGNLNVPSTTAAPQYQDGQQFDTPGLLQQNQFTGNQNVPSTAVPQYQENQRYATPGPVQKGFVPNQQRFGPQVLNQKPQNEYSDQSFPSSTAVPQLQNGQRFTTPEAVLKQQQNQYPGNQNFPSSTPAPQYQYEQRYTTPGVFQKGFVPNQQRFGPQISNQQTENTYGDRNFPSPTAVPQLQNGQRFTTPGPVQQQQQNQYPGNQNFPSSTLAPQYKNEQRYTTPGSVGQIGSLAPGQQNQDLYPGNQFFPTTDTPQNMNQRPQPEIGSPVYTQQNQAQYLGQGNQNIPSSSSRPQFQNGQFVTPGLVQQNQYHSSQIIPSTASPKTQNGQRFTPGPQQGSNQANYPESQTIFENGDHQYPSIGAPQFQSTFSPISGSNLGLIPNQQNLQYPSRPGYNQQFPSTTAPQGFQQQQYGDDRVQTLPGAGVPHPTIQETSSAPLSPGYGNQPSSPTGSQVYGTTPSTPGYYNQPLPNVMTGSEDTIGVLGQNRPERPNSASDGTATILNYDNVLTPEGYMYSYDTSNAIHVDETGKVGDGTKAQGSFSYIGDDGKMYSVIYSADENGFQPRGDHLPTPPPIPEAIQRVIEQANKDKESGIEDDGLYDEEKYGHMKYDGSFRPRNETALLVNGVDIPNSYESRIGGKNRNQLKNKGDKKPNYDEKDNTEYENEEQTDENTFDEMNDNDNDERISNKYPTGDKDLINVANYDKTQKVKINSNANVGSIKRRKPVAGKDTIRRPVSNKIKQDGAFDKVSVTDISEGDDDVERSQDYDENSDLVNYRDDPNSRTDFHGINRYLPNPKGSSRFNQTDTKRIILRPDGTKQKIEATNKSERIGNRKNQSTEDTARNPEIETKEETMDNDRIRTPFKNKIGQKKIESSKTYQQKPANNNDESEINVEDRAKNNEKYGSNDELETGDRDISTQPGVYQFDKKIIGKPKRPNVNERIGVSKNNNIKTISDEETGYEYNPPQRKFDSEGAIRLPSRTSVTRKPQFPLQGGQTTVRPFITPNVHRNDKTEENYDGQFDSESKPFRPIRPITSKVQKNNEGSQKNDRYNDNAYPQITENERFDATRKPTESFSTTPSRRPFGRPQTTAMPSNKGQSTTSQERYDEPNYQGPSRPGNKVIYDVNAPNKGISKTGNNAFVSTTPLPNMGYESFKDDQRPGQYQETNIPKDSSYFKETLPYKDAQKNTPYRPGITNSGEKIPSTTFRPSYTLGDKTLAPSGPITVDGFGRPISSTNAPIYGTTYKPVTQDSRIPIENQPEKVGEFRPNDGRFGVSSAPPKETTGYQGSTPGPSEDFSGPKQPQRFDPDTGYHYK